jgi:hypothetical protein
MNVKLEVYDKYDQTLMRFKGMSTVLALEARNEQGQFEPYDS